MLRLSVAQLSVQPNPKVRFTIRHQDEHVLVIDKPHGLVTQPGKGHDSDTLLNGLFAGEDGTWGIRLQKLGVGRDYGLLHRLDRETSGLLIVALTREAYDALRTQFENREIKKFYWAITSKNPKAASGVIKKPILEVTDVDENGLGEVSFAYQLGCRSDVSARYDHFS